MELDAFNGILFVAQSHNDFAAIRLTGLGAYFQVFGEALLRDDQGMIAGGGHGTWGALKNRSVVMIDVADFSVHNFAGAHDISTEGSPDRLVSQTDAEHRFLSGKIFQEINADAGLLRSAWAGGNHNMGRLEPLDFLACDLVVTPHFYFLTHFTKVLHQVVGEGVVIIEN